MRASLGFSQVVLGTPPNDFATKLDEALEHLFQIKHARLAVDDGQVDDAKGRLHWSQLIQLIEQHLRHSITFQLDYDPHTAAIGFVSKFRYAFQLFLVNELGNAFDQAGFVYLKRYLGDY